MGGKSRRKDAAKPRSESAVKSQDKMRQQLADELRSLYNNVLEEPLPTSMMNFLRDLDADVSGGKDQDEKDRDDRGS